MEKIFPFIVILFLSVSSIFGQTSSVVYWDGWESPQDVYYDSDGFAISPGPVDDAGYSPGSPAFRWATSSGTYQWFWFAYDWYGFDLRSIWDTDSVYFKIKAPAGINTLGVYLYDIGGWWDTSIYYDMTAYDSVWDGSWKQIALPLKDFVVYDQPFDTTQVVAISFESYWDGWPIPEELFFDDIWIGNPGVKTRVTVFNGMAVSSRISYSSWGFNTGNLTIAQGQGYTPGTNAIVWETSDGSGWQGQSFEFDPQDFTYSWMTDTFKIKMKAPAGINNFSLGLYDIDGNAVWNEVDPVTYGFNGDWVSLEIPLRDFALYWTEFDTANVTEFRLENAYENQTISEQVLFTDVWTGNPFIDFQAPPAPQNIIAGTSTPYQNEIIWDDITSEVGETYDVYASLNPISDINAPGVFQILSDVPEQSGAQVHRLYYPLSDGDVSYYYAVNCTDAAGNVSDSSGASTQSYTNTGKKHPIISLNPPQNFVADGFLTEWQHIMPYTLNPHNNRNPYTGTINDSLDYSAKCYVAMDNDYLYVAFDVFDDVFTWQPQNTVDWWDDESIEFFFGLYELDQFHSSFLSGGEPDYRLVFLPDKVLLWSEDSLMSGANYIFDPIGGVSGADYIIEAKIPFTQIQLPEDSTFTPVEGMAIPFEIFAADADVINGGNESRIQLGQNLALNPYHQGPEVWTFAWIGMPNLTSIEDYSPVLTTYFLGENYPNPFNPATTIEYSLANAGNVELLVYNSLGQEVATIVNKHQTAGRYTVDFNATEFASGVYFYKLSTDNFTQVKKMLLIK